MTIASDEAYCFGPFRLFPARQLLLEGDASVHLGGRAFEILAALVERPGEVVTKGELMARVWPTTTVEESNLKVHVAALRRTLGDGRAGRRFIATVSGRGYCFVAPVALSGGIVPAPRARAEPPHNLSLSWTQTIGRADAIDALMKRLPQDRFISLVGPGGIGKTTVAIATAKELLPGYAHGAWFVDLTTLLDPSLVPSATASAIGLTIHSGDILGGLIAHLQSKRMLLVLDNCEHVIEAAAALAEQVAEHAPEVHILATSREPLRARGERVHRLPPLESAPDTPYLTATQALAFPAIQLFVERAAASLGDYELSDADAPVVADICRQLDGIALAIELTAIHVEAFGVHELRALLDKQIWPSTRGRRTAPARQQTLIATLDWSYQLLSEDERRVLRRLAVFAGAFALDSAGAVAADGAMALSGVVEALANLVAKSIVSVDTSGSVVQYRLLETTRAYGLQKLAEHDERDAVVRRHAEHLRDLCLLAESELGSLVREEWLRAYGASIADVRNALNWAFSPGGDRSLGVALTVAALPLWMQLGLMEECRSCVARALACDRAETGHSERDEMGLWAALAHALLVTRGPQPEVGSAWTRALQMAEQLNDPELRLRALWGLSTYHRTRGNQAAAQAFAERCWATADDRGDARARLAAERLIGVALCHRGKFGEARRFVEAFLSKNGQSTLPPPAAGFPYDQQVGALGTLAMILWLQGFPDQAVSRARNVIEQARARFSGPVFGDIVIHSPLPIAILVGDWEAAGRKLELVRESLENHTLSICNMKALCLQGVLSIQRGDPAGLPLLGKALEALREAQFLMRYPSYLGALAQGLALDGRKGEAGEAIDEALQLAERGEELWCLPELLRLKGEILLAQHAPEAAEAHYLRALDEARRQEALSWELRIAMSLARLWHRQGESGRAEALLASVYGCFTEGFETLDLTTARGLLEDLRAAARD